MLELLLNGGWTQRMIRGYTVNLHSLSTANYSWRHFNKKEVPSLYLYIYNSKPLVSYFFWLGDVDRYRPYIIIDNNLVNLFWLLSHMIMYYLYGFKDLLAVTNRNLTASKYKHIKERKMSDKTRNVIKKVSIINNSLTSSTQLLEFYILVDIFLFIHH